MIFHTYSKYGNKKTEVDGHKFDSQKEANRYSELSLMQRACEISGLKLQPRYLLQENFEYRGKKYRKIEYVADFEYTDKETGEIVVEDVKSAFTKKDPLYKIKKKLFLYKYPNLQFFEND